MVPNHRSKGFGPDDEGRRRNTFEADCRAYHIAAQNPVLSPHVPRFFERAQIKDIVESEMRTVRGEYLIDCCYRMEFIDAPACQDRFMPLKLPSYRKS